jgi:hypothetical protein
MGFGGVWNGNPYHLSTEMLKIYVFGNVTMSRPTFVMHLIGSLMITWLVRLHSYSSRYLPDVWSKPLHFSQISLKNICTSP